MTMRTTPTPSDAWRRPPPLGLSPILRHALDAFYENGYHGTSMRDIARRVNVTVPALYYHHDNKEALLVSLLTSSINRLIELCEEAIADAGDDPEARFGNLVECLVLYMAMSTKIAYLDHEIRALSPENRRAYAARRRVVETMLDAAITDGVEAGLFDVTDVHECGRALLGMVQSVPFWFRPGGPTSPRHLARKYLDIAAHTVGVRPDVLARIRARAATA